MTTFLFDHCSHRVIPPFSKYEPEYTYMQINNRESTIHALVEWLKDANRRRRKLHPHYLGPNRRQRYNSSSTRRTKVTYVSEFIERRSSLLSVPAGPDRDNHCIRR